MPGLRRALGPFSATSLVVGGVVGSGIFFGPQQVAAAQPYGLLVLGAWLLGGLISLLGALSIAELGAAMPRSGGTYVYLREAWGPAPAFLSGWAILLSGDGLAPVALVFGTFLQFAAPWGLGAAGYAVLLLAALTAANLVGVRLGAAVGNASTVLKIGALAVLVAAGLGAAQARGLEPLLPAGNPGGVALAFFGAALVPVLFAYDGWYYAARVGEEIRDPGRNLPRAILLGTVLVTALYVVVNFAYLRVLGPEGLAAIQGGGAGADQPSPALALAQVALGPGAVALVVGAVLVSTLGACNTSALTAPRIYFAMARDRLFFPVFARVHPRWGTPHVAVLLHGGVAMLLAATGTFLQLILLSTLSTFLFVGLAVLGVVRLRRTAPDLPRPYRTPGYPWVPLAFVALTAVFVVAAAAAEPLLAGGFLLLVAAGLPCYALLARRWASRQVERVVVLGEAPAGWRPWRH